MLYISKAFYHANYKSPLNIVANNINSSIMLKNVIAITVWSDFRDVS